MKFCSKCKQDKNSDDFSSNQSWCKSCMAEYARQSRLNRYSISVEKYNDILESQGGRCAICGRVPDGFYKFAVDHDHSCCPGKTSCGECIRGLLCGKCNMGLGMFDDNPDFLLSAVSYLG